MKDIKNFFKKFSKLRPTNRIIRKTVFEILKSRDLPVLEDEIIFHNSVVNIKSSQIIKNEIFLIKEDILKEIDEKLKENIVKDIC